MLERLPLEILKNSVSFWLPMEGVIRALLCFQLGELEHGVTGGRMMSIEADKFLVVAAEIEKYPELRDQRGLSHFSRHAILQGMGRLTP